MPVLLELIHFVKQSPAVLLLVGVSIVVWWAVLIRFVVGIVVVLFAVGFVVLLTA
jgi:hypothetical protein